jgi:hypothetical protein
MCCGNRSPEIIFAVLEDRILKRGEKVLDKALRREDYQV